MSTMVLPPRNRCQRRIHQTSSEVAGEVAGSFVSQPFRVLREVECARGKVELGVRTPRKLCGLVEWRCSEVMNRYVFF
jgi:hypothetical protein